VVVSSLVWHAWVGVRDIWMDYIKPVGVRLVLQVVTIVWLVGYAGWAVHDPLESLEMAEVLNQPGQQPAAPQVRRRSSSAPVVPACAASLQLAAAGLQRGRAVQGVPDPLATRWRRRAASAPRWAT
jgi:hypothetical protein